MGLGGKKEAPSRPSSWEGTSLRSRRISVVPPQTPPSGGSPARLRVVVVKEMVSEIERRRLSDFVDGEIVCRLRDFVEGEI